MAISRNISELIIRLKDELSGNSENVRRRIAQLERQIETAAKAALGFAAAAASVAAGLFALTKSASNYADEMGKAAQRTGVGIETLSGLRFAAELADVSFEELQSALVRFSANINDAARGIGEVKASFKTLGITVRNNDGTLRSTDQILFQIADKFSKLPDGTQKTALAYDIFGRAGARLIPLLNSGASGIAEVTEEARRLGIVIDTETAAKAEQFNDNITRLKASIVGLKQSLGNELIPFLNDLTQALSRFIQSEGFKEFMKFATTRLKLLAGDDIGLLEGQIGILSERARELREILSRPMHPGEQSSMIPLLAELERIEREIEINRNILEIRRGAIAAGQPTRPSGVLPLSAAEQERSAKELAERTKKAFGDMFDFLTEEDKQFGQALAKNREEEIKNVIETNERIKQLLLEQLYGPWEAMDQEFMQERIKARDQELEEFRKVQKNIHDFFWEQAKRDRELQEERFRFLTEFSQRAADNMQDAFAQAFDNIGTKARKMSEIVAGFFDAMRRSINQILASQVVDALFGAQGGGRQRTGGILGGIFSGISGAIGGLFGGGGGTAAKPGAMLSFQEGGFVPGPVGKPRLAVVHGGEEVVPSGEGRTVKIFNIDAHGAQRGVSAEIMQAIRMSEDRAVVRSVSSVRDERVRGGNFSRTFD